MTEDQQAVIDLCAIVLAMCNAWLKEKAPEATMDAEMEPGTLYRANLADATGYALAQFRDAFGEQADGR